MTTLTVNTLKQNSCSNVTFKEYYSKLCRSAKDTLKELYGSYEDTILNILQRIIYCPAFVTQTEE